jgi:predicted dehydrogenase
MVSIARTRSGGEGKVRYAVVGLGYIAQAAVLPAFRHAGWNSRLTALVSDDPVKLKKLGRKYGVEHLYSYDEYDRCLHDGVIDAVFIALPNSMHREYTVRAADAGIHVLCEKPMAVRATECREMIDAAERADVRLMVAYRLHFEPANLAAVEIVNSGKIGEPRFFSSTFSMQVKPDNIRLDDGLGGGPVYDIGIYCINAARYLFRAEPVEVCAFAASSDDRRFRAVPEMVAAVLRFPDARLAQFTCSFGAADTSAYTVVGTRGSLCVDPAFEFSEGLAYCLTIDGRIREKQFSPVDQFAPELLHFSDCVRTGRRPLAPGEEGLADVRVIEALNESVETGTRVLVQGEAPAPPRPGGRHEIRRPPVRKPALVHATSPTRE